MDKDKRSQLLPPDDHALAPIHGYDAGTPLRLCVLVQLKATAASGPFVLLRELPGSRAYLGAVCDAEARVQEWVEVWVQTLEMKDVAFSGYQEKLSNHVFDQRWRAECQAAKDNLPELFFATGMEENNPSPVLIKQAAASGAKGFAASETVKWRVCKDDAVLDSFGLPPYSTSPYRYLHEPESAGAKTFLTTSADAPVNSHVQNLERLTNAPGVRAVFNPHAGLVRVVRFSPLELEVLLQILEGRAWKDGSPDLPRFFPRSNYAQLQAWSASPKALPFLLHRQGDADRLNEVLFLKLSVLLDMLKQVRAYVRDHQLPLLNLSPASFRVSLPETGDHFPGLWSAHGTLVKNGQAYPLKIKSTEQKYFIRLGRIEPSPYLPEGLGAHSFGIGSIRVRNVTTEMDGLVLEGTLVAEDYLGLDPHDLLWFKLPLAEERLEMFAHVYVTESAGPREARFRTVPTQLSEPIAAALKRAAGTVFARSPYEIWPLLSSPCDLFSLGVMAVRILLANSSSNLPVVLDEVLGLARRFGKTELDKTAPGRELKSLVEKDAKLLDLISPNALVESDLTPAAARQQIHMGLWFEAMTLMLRLFPGTGTQAYCKDFGDVPPLALETVFHQPIEELESIVMRLRSLLAPGMAANAEIAGVLLEQLAAL